jgi:hypothetical protein
VGLVISMVMITIGAIMRFAVTATADGFNIGTVGMILMVVGAAGAVMSIVFWASWGGFGTLGSRRRTVVTTAAPSAVASQTVVRETTETI